MPDDATPGNPAGFIVDAINNGLGPSQALSAFRDAGGSIRTQTWSRLYGEIGDSLARSPGAAALDPYQLPDPAAYATWSMGRGGQYATDVDVFFRDKDTGLIGSKRYTYVTDEAHTPFEAQLSAIADYGDEDTASNYDQVVVGATTANVYQTVGYGGG